MVQNPYERLGVVLVEFLVARDGYEDSVKAWGNYTLKIEQIMFDFRPRHEAIQDEWDVLYNQDKDRFVREEFEAWQAKQNQAHTDEDQAMVAVLDSYYEAIKDPYLRFEAAGRELLTVLDYLGDNASGIFPLSYGEGRRNLRHNGGVEEDKLITAYENVRKMLANRHDRRIA